MSLLSYAELAGPGWDTTYREGKMNWSWGGGGGGSSSCL